jgi:hypothetical protein
VFITPLSDLTRNGQQPRDLLHIVEVGQPLGRGQAARAAALRGNSTHILRGEFDMRNDLELPPGPEVDGLVQAQVFDQGEATPLSAGTSVPPYSTDVHVSDRVTARLLFFGFALHEHSIGTHYWTVSFVKGPQAREAMADTRAVARCRAALLAVRPPSVA